MEHALAELPLAFFTTLAPVGAGAFITLCVAFFTTTFSEEQLKKIDKLTLIPLVVVVLGFIASFLHLTQPLNATGVFSGVGSSPLSNEILVGSIFLVVAIIYTVIALVGKLSGGLRKVLSAAVAVLAVVFAVFVGMAYMMETIISWNTPFTVVEIVGFTLLGGALLGMLVLALAGSLKEATATPFKPVMYFVTVLGAVAAAGALIAHVLMVGDLSNPLVQGSDLVSEVMMYLVIAAIGLLAAGVCGIIGLTKPSAVGLVVVGVVLSLVAIFIGRLVFYALQLSVGLAL